MQCYEVISNYKIRVFYYSRSALFANSLKLLIKYLKKMAIQIIFFLINNEHKLFLQIIILETWMKHGMELYFARYFKRSKIKFSFIPTSLSTPNHHRNTYKTKRVFGS